MEDRKIEVKSGWSASRWQAMSFLGLSLALALACLASIGGLLWAVYYRLANTPLKGRSLNKPDLPLELVKVEGGVPGIQAFGTLPDPIPARLEKRCIERASFGG